MKSSGRSWKKLRLIRSWDRAGKANPLVKEENLGTLGVDEHETKPPRELSCPPEFMINLSIQNLSPFLGPPLFTSGLRFIEEMGELKLSRTLWGLPGYKSPLLCPVSYL